MNNWFWLWMILFMNMTTNPAFFFGWELLWFCTNFFVTILVINVKWSHCADPLTRVFVFLANCPWRVSSFSFHAFLHMASIVWLENFSILFKDKKLSQSWHLILAWDTWQLLSGIFLRWTIALKKKHNCHVSNLSNHVSCLMFTSAIPFYFG